MATVYYSPYGGKVLAVLGGRDPDYERMLDRSGIEWRTLTIADGRAPKPADVERAVVVGGGIELRQGG